MLLKNIKTPGYKPYNLDEELTVQPELSAGLLKK